MSEADKIPPPQEPQESWPEIVFPQPLDENRLIVSVEGAILAISREHIELED